MKINNLNNKRRDNETVEHSFVIKSLLKYVYKSQIIAEWVFIKWPFISYIIILWSLIELGFLNFFFFYKITLAFI